MRRNNLLPLPQVHPAGCAKQCTNDLPKCIHISTNNACSCSVVDHAVTTSTITYRTYIGPTWAPRTVLDRASSTHLLQDASLAHSPAVVAGRSDLDPKTISCPKDALKLLKQLLGR